jgi:cytochrome c-type biogenesis protein CcmF
VLLAISAFSLSLLGTFLVRSGVLSSVHAFATDPKRGLFILAFLVIVIGASLLLYAWRASQVGLGQRFGLVSRESLLLMNNMLLAVATAAVLLGTLYPLFLDALGLGKISVGPPYFDTVFALLMAPLVLTMGLGPLARWKNDQAGPLLARVKWSAVFAVLAAVATAFAEGGFSAWGFAGLLMGWWIVASVATDLLERLGKNPVQWPGRFALLPRAMLGMLLAHVGVAVFIFGVTIVKTYEVERDVKMNRGDTTEINGYVFKMISVRDVEGPNYVAAQGLLEVTKNGRLVATMQPEKRVYRVQQNPMTEAAIDTNPLRDLYVSMGEPVEGGAWVVRVQHKPLVTWIWGGCVLMALGGLLAASDRRYRVKKTADDPLPAGLAPGVNA